MAQHKVVDLVIQRGSVQIVHRMPTTPARTSGEGPAWLMRSPGSWRGLVAVGAASTGAGLLLSAVTTLGSRMLTIWFANSLLSAGLCLLMLGVIKRVMMTQPAPAAAPTPEVIDPKLLGERSRRVRAILSKVTAASELYTFERLVKESRWTQAAMLSTLLHMKERSEIVEDLNLDTGEWVYSLADDVVGAVAAGPGSLMLEERTAQASAPERQG